MQITIWGRTILRPEWALVLKIAAVWAVSSGLLWLLALNLAQTAPAPVAEDSAAGLQFLAVVLGWMGFFLLLELVYRFWGVERISFSQDQLCYRIEVCSLGWTRYYPLAQVCRLRYLPYLSDSVLRRSPFKYPNALFGTRWGLLGFEHQHDTVQIGVGLSDDEAKQIMAYLRAQLPSHVWG